MVKFGIVVRVVRRESYVVFFVGEDIEGFCFGKIIELEVVLSILFFLFREFFLRLKFLLKEMCNF